MKQYFIFLGLENMDNITDMRYSLNRVSPIFGEQQIPVQSPILEIQHQHPDIEWGQINKTFLCSTGCWHTNRKEGASLYDPNQSVENHLWGEAAGPDNETQGNTSTYHQHKCGLMFQIPFQKPPRGCTQYKLVLLAKLLTDIHSHPTRGPGKKVSKQK